MTGTPDLLAAIVGATRHIIETRRELVPTSVLDRQAAARSPQRDAFRAALRRPGRVNVIAECKRRSPSKGVLRHDYAPKEIAEGYARAGAVALSVLTEPTFFDGALAHLTAVRETVSIPLLRKDFIVDEYQLLEARAAGADAVLLIVAALEDEALRRLQQAAAELELATLVEVHDGAELERAVAAGADVIGINNRNLRTLEVDVHASHDIAARMPSHVTMVSESGLKTAADIEALRRLGYHAFLIGERFMTAADPGAALSDLLVQAACGSEPPQRGCRAGDPGEDPPLPMNGDDTADHNAAIRTRGPHDRTGGSVDPPANGDDRREARASGGRGEPVDAPAVSSYSGRGGSSDPPATKKS